MQGKQLWVQWAIHMAYDPLDMLLWELQQPGKQQKDDGNIKHPQSVYNECFYSWVTENISGIWAPNN